MPYVLNANREAIAERIASLARYLDLPTADVDGFLTWILGLRRELAIPHTLAEIGIESADAERIGRMAAAD